MAKLSLGRSSASNPYVAGRAEWNERYGSYVAREKAWRLAAIMALGVALLAVGALGWSSMQSRVVPYIVEVDKLGGAAPVALAETTTPADPRVVRSQVARWLGQCRSIYADQTVVRAAIEVCYSMLDPDASSFKTLTEYHRTTMPFQRAGEQSVTVQVQSVLPLSKSSWRVEWIEEIRNLDGSAASKDNWQAVVGVSIAPPTDERQILENPLGIFISSVSWSRRI